VPTQPPVQWVPGLSSFPGVKYGLGVLLTTHPILVPWSWKSRAIPLSTIWATTGPVTGTLYTLSSINYTPSWRTEFPYHILRGFRRRLIIEVKVAHRASRYGFEVDEWHWDTFFTEHLCFLLVVSFHQIPGSCSFYLLS